MSESDTMFNERDRRCTAVQIMLSTDPSYDNRTIASTLKMQIWIAMNNRDEPRVMKTKFPATIMVFGVVSSEGHIMPPHIFEVGLKVNTKVYLDVLKSVVIPWVWRMVWALTSWPPTFSISAAMLTALLRRSFKESIWMWRSARALSFFGRPTRSLFWVDPALLKHWMILATVLLLSFRVMAIFL